MDANEREHGDEAALSEGLRRILEPPASARPEFKEAVRERFLGRSLVEKSDLDSSSLAPSEPRSAPNSMIEDVLDNLPPMPKANPEFRAALKVAFLEGRAEGAALGVAQEAESISGSVVGDGHQSKADPTIERAERAPRKVDSPRAAHRRSHREDSPFTTRNFSWQVVTGIAAIAAAILLLVLFPKEPEPERRGRKLEGWTVAATGTELEIDNVKFAVGRNEALALAINGAGTLASLDCSLELSLKNRVRLGMEPDSLLDYSAAELPKFAPEGSEADTPSSDELYFKLEAGELHLMTSRSNPAQVIIVETPHAKVRITGSVLSIQIFDDEGTCICVKDGEATIEVLSGTSDGVRVGDDSTCFVFASGEELKFGPSSTIVPHEHLEPLLAFYDAEF